MESTNKLLSVVIPCYNSQAYMRKSISSVLTAGDEVEILVVDDGSSDDTLKIAKEFEAKYPGIVRAIHQENKGHGGAVNTGIANATGKYFKVLDSDDWFGREAFKNVMDVLRAHADKDNELDMLISNYIYDKQGAKRKTVMQYRSVFPIGQDFTWADAKYVKPTQYLLMHSIIYRRQVLLDSGLKLPEHTFYVDNLVAYQPFTYVHKLYYLDVNLYHYFIGRADQSVNEDVMRGRLDQQIRVNELMIDELMNIKKRTVDKDAKRFMVHMLNMIMTISTVFLSMEDDYAEGERRKKALWDRLKKEDAGSYYSIRFTALGLAACLPGKIGNKILIEGYHFFQYFFGFN